MVKQISSTLTITIRRQAENYTIEANGPKGIKVDPQPAPQLKTLLSDQEITNILKDLSSQTAPATTEAIQKLGKALYDALFIDQDLLKAFYKTQGSASTDSGVRLRLQIEPAELAAFPWETLHDGKDWLSTQSITPLVRKLALSENRKPIQKLQIRGALRILFVGASPEDLDKLEVEKTADVLETLLDEPIKKKQIVFHKLLNATIEKLRQELLKDYHILYFAGHGSPKGIYLHHHREHQDTYLVSAEELADALAGKQTRLVFLAACETSKASDKTSEGSRLLRGFAQELAEQSNLPAIAAMQYFISDMQALPLTTQFFAALAAGRPVDVAMAEARSVLIKKGQVSRDVFSPVLYLQADDGALFPKAKNWPTITGISLVLIVTTVAGFQFQQAQRQRVEQWAATAKVLGESQPVNAVMTAIAAKGLSQSWFLQFPNHPQFVSIDQSLLDVIPLNWEQNQMLQPGGVISAMFSADGQRILSSGRNEKVQVWDAKTGTPISGFSIQAGEVWNEINSVALSPDGKRIASGSIDGMIRVWDANTGELIGKPWLGSNYGGVEVVAFSPDGKRIASGSQDKTVQALDVSTGNPIGKPMTHTDLVTSVAFSHDGKHIASGSQDKTVRVWDANTGNPIGKPLTSHTDAVTSVAFSPDGKRIVSGSGDKTVRVWDASTGNPIGKPLTGHTDAVPDASMGALGFNGVTSVAFSPDGQRIVSGGDDRTVRVWDANTGDPIGKPLMHEDLVTSVAFSPDSKRIVSGSKDGTVRVWDANPVDTVGSPLIVGNRSSVWGISAMFSSGGKHIISTDNFQMKVWDVNTGNLFSSPFHLQDPGNINFNAAAFSPDGKRMVSGSQNGTVQVWDANTGNSIGKPLTGHKGFVNSVVFSADGKRILSSGFDNTVRVWDVSTGNPIGKPITLTGAGMLVAFSPDGQRIVSSDGTWTLRVWDANRGDPISNPWSVSEKGGATSVAFSADGKRIVSGHFDKTLRVWDPNTGNPIGRPFIGHEDAVNTSTAGRESNGVYSVAFSPDGQRIVSGGSDRTVRVWDANTGDPIGNSLIGHAALVTSVAFSPDGKRIVSGSKDGTVRVWYASWVYLLEKGCNQLRYHPSLNRPTTDVARRAKQTCEEYVWKL